jgi:CRISPR type III-A/MTUBE-associated protein Csm6
MNKKILFSPVGGTDPISSTNYRDGSLLHICRVYQPDKVVLYMSKEILDNQEKDDRYRYCLDRLAKMQKRTMEYKIIERPELRNVHEFDYFYGDFRGIIEELFKEMDDTDSLLINVSSGTPQMKSGLLVLRTLGEFPCETIQVATPERKMNNHIHDGYDVEVLWELNEDNGPKFENRCKPVKCPTLSEIKSEEIMKKHISVYDYRAALDVAETLPREHTERYIDMLQMAASRLLLDMGNVDKILNRQKVYQLPVRGSNSRKYFEYALNLNVKLKREEYADFVRGTTPLIVDLFELILKRKYKINIDEYCYWQKKKEGKCDRKKRTGYKNDSSEEKQKGVRKWDRKKLFKTELLRALEKGYGKPFLYGDIKSDNLKILIEYYSDDPHLKELVSDLRGVEENLRNQAAHQIVSITDQKIKDETGFTGKQIMDMIKELFRYTGINIADTVWNSYEEMNQIIINLIG